VYEGHVPLVITPLQVECWRDGIKISTRRFRIT